MTIDQDRTLHVHIRLNLLSILEGDANNGDSTEPTAVATGKVGTYTRIFDLYRIKPIVSVVERIK